MSAKVVQQVVAEVTADTTKLDAGLRDAEKKTQRTKAQIEGTGTAARGLGNQYAGAARQIASASETIARSGNVTGEAAKQILAAGGSIAFAFGPAGAAAGALSIFALAVATAMRSSRDEAEKTARAFDATLESFRLARDYRGAGGQVVSLLQGDPGAESEAERLGLLRLRERVARERAAVGPISNVPIPVSEQSTETRARQERIRLLRENEAALATLEKRYQTANQTFEVIAQQEQERLANERSAAEEEKRLADSRAAVQRAQTDATREELRAREQLQKEALDFTRDFNQVVLRELGSSADQIAATFDALIERGLQAEGADSPRVRQLRELKAAAVDAAQAIEASQTTLRNLDSTLAAGGQVTVATFEELTQRTDELRTQLARLQPQSQQYLAVQQQLREVEQRRADLLKDPGKAPSGDGNTATRTAADLAREIQQAVDGALQLAAAFGAVDAQVLTVLRSLGQVAGNLPALATALKVGNGLGALSAALPIAGALASLIGDSPAEQQRSEELRRNTEAIRELTLKAGLLGSGVTGGDAAAAIPVLQDFLRRSGGGQIIAGGRTYSATDQATIAAERLGILPELQRIAAQYGITLNRNITSFEQLLAAIQDTITKLGEFGTDLDSALQQADAEAAIFGITDPLAKLGLKTGALAGRSSAFDSLTAGLDLNTAEGREQARKNAQALFEILKAGGDTLSADQLGGLTGQQLLDAILALVGGLNEVDEAQGTNTSTATQADQVVTADRTQITADQASRLLGLASAQLAELRLIRAALDASVNPIPLPSPSVFGGGAAGAGTVIQSITIEINNLGAVTGAELGAQMSDALVDALNRALGTRVVIARQNAGKAVLS